MKYLDNSKCGLQFRHSFQNVIYSNTTMASTVSSALSLIIIGKNMIPSYFHIKFFFISWRILCMYMRGDRK